MNPKLKLILIMVAVCFPLGWAIDWMWPRSNSAAYRRCVADNKVLGGVTLDCEKILYR